LPLCLQTGLEPLLEALLLLTSSNLFLQTSHPSFTWRSALIREINAIKFVILMISQRSIG
jgi:hypothetical protein